MESASISVLCTVGSGLEELLSSELETLSIDSIQKFPGKFTFKVKQSIIPNLLKLKFVERIFWLLLTTEWKTSDNPQSIVTFVRESLGFLNESDFTLNRSIWLNNEPQSTIHAHLFVKMRPKVLIRHTRAVHEAAVEKLNQLLNVDFCSSSTNSMNLMICGSRLFLGIPISKSPLSKRAYMIHSGLRSTTAAALTRNIKDGLLLDPMCGKAITLCEAAGHVCDRPIRSCPPRSPFVFLIGTDCNTDQLSCARTNLANLDSDYQRGVIVSDLVCCSLECHPFRDGVFDDLVCDLPFGHKHGVCSLSAECFDMNVLKSFYEQWLTSISRLLSFRGKYSLLVSPNLSTVAMDHLQSLDMCSTECIHLPMGKTFAVMLMGGRNEPKD